jgi:hypothetical protein
MPSRRAVLYLCSLTAASAASGCSTTREQPKPVNVLLQNDDTEEWSMTVAVEDEAEEVFRTEETIPADGGTRLGEVLIENAFEGAPGDQFTVHAWFDGEPSGTFDYEITCRNDNRFSFLVEHRRHRSEDGEPVDYLARWCAD